jgi:hypothetical protein
MSGRSFSAPQAADSRRAVRWADQQRHFSINSLPGLLPGNGGRASQFAQPAPAGRCHGRPAGALIEANLT